MTMLCSKLVFVRRNNGSSRTNCSMKNAPCFNRSTSIGRLMPVKIFVADWHA